MIRLTENAEQPRKRSDKMIYELKEEKASKMLEEFFNLLPKLNAIEFLGLTKILCVPLVDEEENDRDFADLLDDVLTKFEKCGRSQKREILRALRSVAK